MTATTDPVTGYQYGDAGGFTPNVVVGYNPDPKWGLPFTLWPSGYGSLSGALSHQYSSPGSLDFRPGPGFVVTLTHFDVADWPNSRVVVSELGGTTLYDSGSITVPGASCCKWSFVGSLSSSSGLRLELFDFGPLGLDNVQFSQAAVIPEPGSDAMLLAGLAVVGAVARRRHLVAG